MRFLKYILIVVTAFLYACEELEPEYLFDQSPEERMSELVGEYTDILVKPEYGWIGYYTSVGEIGGFAVLLKFNTDGSVKIKNEAVGFANIESSEEDIPWRVGVGQHPELVFESACIFTRWCAINFDSPLSGGMKGGEFQFVIEAATEDLVILRSKTDLTDVTRLYLRKAQNTDWDFRGMSDFSEKLEMLTSNSIIIDRKFVGEGQEKFMEFDGKKRYVIVEGEEGEAKLYRFAITRSRIVMLDTIIWGDKPITGLKYDDTRKELSADGDIQVKMQEVTVTEPKYIRPQFLPELVAQNADVLTGPWWVWTADPDLAKVEMLDVQLKDYSDFYGLEYLPNLRSLSIMGIFGTNSKIDVSKNKRLRKLVVMMNMKEIDIKYDHLEELEEVVFTYNPSLKEVDMRTSCKNLKHFYAHMCDTTNFRVNLSGANKLIGLYAQQNGWQSLDITGCSALEEVLINSGGGMEQHESDHSICTMSDIIGLDASVQRNLTTLYVPKSAVCGDNVKKFYKDCMEEGRELLMMFGHSLIKPETDPENIYNENTCSHE
ncbi:MAG: DUF4302 domain-containing protein [Odoribacter splanchnicus]